MKRIIMITLLVLAITSCQKEEVRTIDYPTIGLNGLNMLNDNNNEFSEGTASINAIIGDNSKLQIMIVGDGWTYELPQDFSGFSVNGNVFTSTKSGAVDFKIIIEDNPIEKKLTILYYENSSKITRKKDVFLK